MKLFIRPVHPDDAPAIVELLNPIIASGRYTVLDTPLTPEFERQFIANYAPRGIFNVAVRPRDGRVTGLQNIEPFANYSHAFDHVGVIGTFVNLALLRQGIGRRLSEVTMREAREKGYEKLFSYVRADNPAALAFYQGLGFEIVGTARRQARIVTRHSVRYIDEIVIECFI